jgi:hypothetical protein
MRLFSYAGNSFVVGKDLIDLEKPGQLKKFGDCRSSNYK